jgi:transporter family-2 protein
LESPVGYYFDIDDKQDLKMQTIMYLSLTFVMGIIMSIYLPMNSSVARYLESSITANVTFFMVALLTSIVIFLIFGQSHTMSKVQDVPFYLYLTGFISAFIVLGTTFVIPFIGARKFFILLIAGQIVMAVIVSHFGILESPKDPINMKKLIGAAMVLIGAVISTS